MKASQWFAGGCVLVLAALACTFPGAGGGGDGISQTQVALAVQQTSIVIQQWTLNAPTLPAPAETYTPYPTYTPPAPAQPSEEAPVVTSTSAVDITESIKTSNILIFEDIVGYTSLKPIVSDTIRMMDFSGGKIVNAGDAMGKFKEYANSATEWDLIVIAAEVRSTFSGEMFEMIYDHVNNGGATIIEVWYLDDVASGKIAPILSKCGVRFSRDWTRNRTYDPFDYSIYWLDTSHLLLSTPNVVSAPSYPYPEWFADAGDLLELGAGGDATLVGGLHPDRTSDYGVLASCMGGRMVIQTFSSHDYKWDVMQPLWENYITYTLTKHYEYKP